MNIAIVDEEKIELETAETFLRFYIKKILSRTRKRNPHRNFSARGRFSPSLQRGLVSAYHPRCPHGKRREFHSRAQQHKNYFP